MSEDRQLEAFKKYVLGQLGSEPHWQVRTAAGLWVCPYCGMEGAHWQDERADMLKEVLGHLFYRCNSFRGGKGAQKSEGRLREFARLHDFHRRVRKDPAFFVVDKDRRWYDPYTGSRTTLKVKGAKATVGELTRMLQHLDKAAPSRAADGSMAAPMSIDELQLSVKLHTDPVFRCYDALSRWYDPFTLEPTSIRLDPNTRRISTAQVRECWEHLSNSIHYRANSGTPPHPYESVRDAVKRGNKRLMLTQRIRKLVRREPVWTVQSEAGYWMCPFCQDQVETVDVRTPFLLREVAPRQMARHIIEQCASYKTGCEPARSAGELVGTPMLGSGEETTTTAGTRRREADYDAAAAAFDRLQKRQNIDAELQAILDARPSEEEIARERAVQEEQRRTMERARQVQLGMLPKVPRIDPFEIEVVFDSCDEVSGDFYDFVEVSEHEWGIVVGDVAGHGVHAALVMAAAKKALKIRGKGVSSPREALIQLNEDLKPELPASIFVTIWYGVLNLRTMTLTHARAGHNPLLVFNANTKPALRKYEPQGMIVGMAPGAIFSKTVEEETIVLRPGDLVLQYTDGVTEAMDQAREEYGEDRLDAFLTANGSQRVADFVQALRSDIQTFRRGAEPNDDVTMLALRYLGREGVETPAEAVPAPRESAPAERVAEPARSQAAEALGEADANLTEAEPIDAGESTDPQALASEEFFALVNELDDGTFDGSDPFAPIEPADDIDGIEPVPVEPLTDAGPADDAGPVGDESAERGFRSGLA